MKNASEIETIIYKELRIAIPMNDDKDKTGHYSLIFITFIMAIQYS